MRRSLLEEWKVNDTPVVSPDAGIKVKRIDVECDDSGEDESGFHHSILRRSGVYVWGFTYSLLEKDEYWYMENLLTGKGTFQFSYPGADGKTLTCTARCLETSTAWLDHKTGKFRDYEFEIMMC